MCVCVCVCERERERERERDQYFDGLENTWLRPTLMGDHFRYSL